MESECQFSFSDLYEAAFGRKPTLEEIAYLKNFSQEELNKRVKEWAKKADWNALDIVGTDGKIYTAFYPKWGKRLL